MTYRKRRRKSILEMVDKIMLDGEWRSSEVIRDMCYDMPTTRANPRKKDVPTAQELTMILKSEKKYEHKYERRKRLWKMITSYTE